jgi:hypothetical protein
MNADAIAQLIVQKGLSGVNLTMFSEIEKKAILSGVAEIYLRQGKSDEVMEILEYIDLTRFLGILKSLAEKSFQLGEYEKAAKLYERIGEAQLAKYITDNFLKK